ncbi:MAG: hypothetical protein U1A24_01660 [Cypionkella sp.]|uniref:hypothetical protein n=1 Tax=Cypionkella sp. TaxID=2811411 RepID=UPI002ABAC558|nr:hypothetical protein [Cypionkella sp.]MDZ4309255.1 hypothetical protein [Cypionkella sp.]
MQNKPVFRIDKFVVPAITKDRFLGRLTVTHDAMDAAAGCEQNFIPEQVDGRGQYNIVTLVKWKDRECYEAAKKRAVSRQAEEGFNPAAFMKELGVVADLGNYTVLQAAS